MTKERKATIVLMPTLKLTKEVKASAKMSPLGPPPSIQTPSPRQVISDLIDSTCHEIFSLQGEMGTESIPSVASFAILAQRLDYFLGQLEEVTENEPLLTDPNVRTRLLLAKLVLDICVRSAYLSKDDDADTSSQMMPPLIDMTVEQWNDLQHELEMVPNTVLTNESDHSSPLNSLIYQVKALGAIAKLRSQLNSAITKIEEDEGKIPSKKNRSTTFSFISSHLDEYNLQAKAIKDEINCIDNNLFIPSQMLHMKRCSTIQRVKASVISLVECIDDLVAKKFFPLKQLQTSLLSLLTKLEQDLPVPTLFRVGYFKSSSATPSSSSASIKKSKSSNTNTPVSPSATSSIGNSSNRETRKHLKKPVYREETSDEEETSVLAKKRKIAKREKNYSEFDFESDDEVELKFVSSKKKQTKRVPYSEEEKGALLQGVETFGKGNWAQIRDHYVDIFKVNNRTTVNLKDLYRTLTK